MGYGGVQILLPDNSARSDGEGGTFVPNALLAPFDSPRKMGFQCSRDAGRSWSSTC